MPKVDVEKLKAAVIAAKAKRVAQAGVRHVTGADEAQLLKSRQALKEMGSSFLAHAGLDPQRIKELVSASTPLPASSGGGPARNAAESEQQFQRQLQEQRATMTLLTQWPYQPLDPYYIYLDTPFLIWETPNPNLNILQDWQIAQGGSTVLASANYMNGSADTYFTFYYLWENSAEIPAVVNVSTVLIFNGNCSVSAAGGVFHGDKCGLIVNARLELLEWWSSPPSSPIFQSSQTAQVLSISASGPTFPEYLWKQSDETTTPLDYFAQQLSYQMFQIPPLSTAVFEVSAELQFGFTAGGFNLSDLIVADFASADKNYKIVSPSIALQVIQGPPQVRPHA
jgi:hypothetical protein